MDLEATKCVILSTLLTRRKFLREGLKEGHFDNRQKKTLNAHVSKARFTVAFR